ncbi:protein AAR2 homolog [Uranotaenia lowii]|uniref:protein AAR2 homolog n=1 Tax=Uranotaenia lowii TaxID=190385 RepID=UPI002479FA3A|nr:protein AAR2 homolog [Uranotaenia lowii]
MELSTQSPMDPNVARKLFDNCAFLIIAGVPVGTSFGIDLRSYVVGADFRGVKMIPEGFHFVHCASQGPYGETAPRVGFCHYFKRNEIVVREWDNEKEELRLRIHENVEQEVARIRENLRNLDRYLAPYDYNSLSNWTKLTGNIIEQTIKNHSPECGVIRNTVELLSCSDENRPRGKNTTIDDSPRLSKMRSLMNEEELLPNLEAIPGSAPKFTELPPRCPKEASPEEISRHHIDSILAVEKLLTGREESIFAEIEFSFVLFLCGHSVEGLNHWRRILLLLSNSELAVEKFRTFYKNYLTVLQYQLPQLPIELMEQTQHNTVYLDTRRLLLNCYQGGLTTVAQTLEKSLKESLLWKFEDLFAEDPEDLPTVVEL